MSTEQQKILSQTGDNPPTIWQYAWSPDGSKIACAMSDATIKIFEIENGKVIKTLGIPGRHKYTSLAWNHNNIDLFSCSDTCLVKWNTTEGTGIYIEEYEEPYKASAAKKIISIKEKKCVKDEDEEEVCNMSGLFIVLYPKNIKIFDENGKHIANIIDASITPSITPSVEEMTYFSGNNEIFFYTNKDLYIIKVAAIEKKLNKAGWVEEENWPVAINISDKVWCLNDQETQELVLDKNDRILNVSLNYYTTENEVFNRILIQTTKKLAIVERYWTGKQDIVIIDDKQLNKENIIVFNPYVNDMIISAGKQGHFGTGYSKISIWKLEGGEKVEIKHVFESKLNCTFDWFKKKKRFGFIPTPTLDETCDGFVNRFKISPKGDKLAVVGSYGLAQKLRILNIPGKFDELGNWYPNPFGPASTVPIQLMSNLKLRF